MAGTPKDERNYHYRAVSRRGTIRGIIGTSRQWDAGYILPRGDRAVFHEWSWSDEDTNSAEKRIKSARDNKAFMRSDYIACPNSLDEITLGAVFRKAVE